MTISKNQLKSVTSNPSTVPTIGPPVNLNAFANSIKSAHAQVVKSLRAGLEYARLAGEHLSRANATMNSREFAAWVKTECGFSESTAYNYIRIFKNWRKIQGEKNYVKALRALRTRKNKKAKAPAPNLTPWQRTIADRMARFFIKGKVHDAVLFLESFGVKKEGLKIVA